MYMSTEVIMFVCISCTALSTSYSAFDYELMDPLEHEWIMFAVQNNQEGIERLMEEEPNLVHKKVYVNDSPIICPLLL